MRDCRQSPPRLSLRKIHPSIWRGICYLPDYLEGNFVRNRFPFFFEGVAPRLRGDRVVKARALQLNRENPNKDLKEPRLQWIPRTTPMAWEE